MKRLPPKIKALLQKPVFVHFATVMDDGGPQVSPVWVDVDGDIILVNSAEGRLKDRNVRRDPRVALSVTDPENPYRSVSIRGRVIETTTKGATEHIDKMAKKYLGRDRYPGHKQSEQRVIYKVQPEKIATMG